MEHRKLRVNAGEVVGREHEDADERPPACVDTSDRQQPPRSLERLGWDHDEECTAEARVAARLRLTPMS